MQIGLLDLTLEEIPLGSLWMASDGEPYGLYVFGKNYENGDVWCLGFNQHGWYAENNPIQMDYFKLQYRYFLAA
jgi:hypothetical protein